eukprot:Skav220926  [mRNA]  locus=scaffold3184:33854:44829:+ [translate_table: standard]
MASWLRKKVPTAPPALLSMLALLLSTLLLVANAEWEEVSGFPQTYARYYGPHAAAMSEDASKTVIVGRKEIYVVTDYDFANKVEVDFDALFTDMEGSLHVAAMSKDGSKIVIGGHQGGHVYLSSDGGETWTRDATLPARTYTGAAVSGDGSKIVVCNNPTYGSGDNELQMSSDGGATWTAVLSGPRFNDCAMSEDGQTILGTGQAGKFHKSVDGGLNFTEYGDTIDWHRVAMSADGQKIMASVMYAAGQISLDGGDTWTANAQHSETGDWDDVAITPDGSKMYVITGGLGDGTGKLYSSTDDGATWVQDFDGDKRWETLAMSQDGNVMMAIEKKIQVEGWPTTTSTTTTGTTTTVTTMTSTMTSTYTDTTTMTSVTNSMTDTTTATKTMTDTTTATDTTVTDTTVTETTVTTVTTITTTAVPGVALRDQLTSMMNKGLMK